MAMLKCSTFEETLHLLITHDEFSRFVICVTYIHSFAVIGLFNQLI